MPPKRKTAAAAVEDSIPTAKRVRTTTATEKAETPKRVAPKRAAATKTTTTTTAAPRKAAAAKKTPATTKTAAAKKTAATKAAPKTAAKPVPKKATAATKAAPKKTVAATKEAAAAKKVTAAANKKNTKSAADSSDKENEDAAPKANSKRKRDEEEELVSAGRATKRAQAPAAPKRAVRQLKVINKPPTQVMDIFLGLGSFRVNGKKPIDVKRPRLNPNLKGVVQVACGGMHVAALTKDNKILTWGVNDQGALGRDTTWDGGLRDVDAKSDASGDSDEDDDTGMNPKESTPAEIDTTNIPENTTWVQIVASDSATFALTTTGQVYGWGTFRSNDGVLGFSRSELVQHKPALIPEISKIKQLAAGLNHVLAIDEKNKVFAWGAGQQGQLARRLLERDDSGALYPTGIGALPKRAKAAGIACGSYHSFAVDTKNRVYGWGLNNYAELGVEEAAGTDGGYVMRPAQVTALDDADIVAIAGGEHHSLACTKKGDLLTWGRIDGHQVGQPSASFSEDNTIWDERHTPRILMVPTAIPGIKNVVAVAAGTDHSFAVTAEGRVYSWGFSANYQTGQGTMDDIPEPMLIDNSAIKDRKVVFAGAGGQYGILGALPEDEE
ncbi:hypothetical protein N0V88_007699 [Collariella sp. IMI 366227]|nr:hypothetical protein N0V88_007699 [Collariella sp. IMI 366227]